MNRNGVSKRKGLDLQRKGSTLTAHNNIHLIPGIRSRWEFFLSKTVNNKSDAWSNTASEMIESMKVLFSAFQTRQRKERKMEESQSLCCSKEIRCSRRND